MSDTYLCFDCRKSITFIGAGMQECVEEWKKTRNNTTMCLHCITFVRCDMCVSMKGSLGALGSSIPFTSKNRGILIDMKTLVASFMKTMVARVGSMSRGMNEEDINYAYDDMRVHERRYMLGLACVSITENGVTNPDAGFSSVIDIENYIDVIEDKVEVKPTHIIMSMDEIQPNSTTPIINLPDNMNSFVQKVADTISDADKKPLPDMEP